jgi:hypothetical protein
MAAAFPSVAETRAAQTDGTLPRPKRFLTQPKARLPRLDPMNPGIHR